jgi:hypothetical protein
MSQDYRVGASPPNQELQQAAGAMLVSRDFKALSTADAAELCR